MIRIVHVITGLNTGGAETMLATLLAHTDRTRFDPTVICLTGDGPIGERIRQLGVPLHVLRMPRGFPHPVGLARLMRLLRQVRPEIVQTWLYHSDLIGGLASRLTGTRRVVWSIHNTVYDPKIAKRSTVLAGKFCAKLAPMLPARIISCSRTAMREHIALGYPEAKTEFIPNGFDTNLYRPNNAKRDGLRRELGIMENAPVIGMFARFDPMKDHQTFLRAAKRLNRSLTDTRFILCGQGVTADNPELIQGIAEAGIEQQVHLLGVRTDIPRLLCALDLLVLSSRYGEAFPMVIGEAMATGVPCVATDVGDAAYLIGETGKIVPPADPQALSCAARELLILNPDQRTAMSRAARMRVQEDFEITHIARRYAAFYEEML